MKLTLKKLLMPLSNKTKEVDSIQLWGVKWESRYGAYSGDTDVELAAFASEELANEFAASLRAAFKLLRFRHGTYVKVYKM